jgi:hypothetical protein
MMRHADIWRGIDRLAAHNGLSASGLARLAGLDATAFNPSKRTAKDGRPRWPSTESVASALSAVGAGFDDLAAMIEGGSEIGLVAFQVLVLKQSMPLRLLVIVWSQPIEQVIVLLSPLKHPSVGGIVLLSKR